MISAGALGLAAKIGIVDGSGCFLFGEVLVQVDHFVADGPKQRGCMADDCRRDFNQAISAALVRGDEALVPVDGELYGVGVRQFPASIGGVVRRNS